MLPTPLTKDKTQRLLICSKSLRRLEEAQIRTRLLIPNKRSVIVHSTQIYFFTYSTRGVALYRDTKVRKTNPKGKKRKWKEDQFLSLFCPRVPNWPHFAEHHRQRTGPVPAKGGSPSSIQYGFCHFRTQAQFCQIWIFQQMPKIQVFKKCEITWLDNKFTKPTRTLGPNVEVWDLYFIPSQLWPPALSHLP